MSISAEGILEQFSKRKALVSIAVAAALVATSALAMTALSGPAGEIVLTILGVTASPEEAYVDEAVVWTVVVEVQDHGQQGKGLLFTWDWDDGTYTVTDINSIGSASTATDVQSHSWSEPGVYDVVVSVWDGYGPEQNAFHNVSAEMPFTVNAPVVLTPHGPIHIEGDQEFADMAAAESWPGSGVEGDPYLIGPFEISMGGSGTAIWVQDTTVHFVVRGCQITDAYTSGVHLLNVVNAAVEDSVFTSCSFYSIYCEQSDGLSLTGNTIYGGTHCVGVIDCRDVFMGDCLVEECGWWPLWLAYSTDVTLRGNSFIGSGLEIGGGLVSHWNSHDIDDSNTVNGKPVYYFKDQNGGGVPAEAGQIILANCTGMSVQSDVVGRISIGFGAGNTVSGSSVSSVHYGLTISFSAGNTVDSVSIVDCFYGILTDHAPDTLIANNRISGCEHGMWIQTSDGTTITGNSVLDSRWWGIFLTYVSNGQVRDNLIAGSSQEGMHLVCADANLITHNDFVDNAIQAGEYLTTVENIWDGGYPAGGNYWSDYSGVDLYSGPDQTVPGPDGIGDTPYVLPSGSQDRYPLMEPVTELENSAPVALFTADPPAGPAGMELIFDASASYDAEDPAESLQVRWDWESDGVWDTEYSADREAGHSYAETGAYTVSLEVMDSDGMTGLASQGVSVLEPTGLSVRAPISIESDDGFTAENGVVAGSGSPGDPYIISGWSIGSADSCCISIANTSVCFVVYGVQLTAGSFDFFAMSLRNVSDGHVVASVLGGGYGGLAVDLCSSVSVVGCDFADGVYGVEAISSAHFGLRSCAFAGVLQALTAYWSYGLSVESCDMVSEYTPCWLSGCYQGAFTDNRIKALGGWGEGAYLMDSEHMELANNSFTDCSIDIVGWRQECFDTHTITPDNTVNGRPILFYKGLSGLVVDGADAGEVIVVDCEDVAVSNMQFSDGFAGVIAAYSDRVAVEDNSFTSCWIGVRVMGCTEVAVRGNVLEGVVQQGIGLWDTEGADVEGNTLSSGFFGYQDLMPVYHCSDVRIADNILADSWRGVAVFSAYGVEVSGNAVSDMVKEGASIAYSSGVLVTGNVFEGNGVGLSLERCSLASVHHNDFLGNDVQALDVEGTDNLWDDGYPSGGNYWSDYRGEDDDGDGIGDTPYLFEVGAQDRYPLMLPCAG